MNKSSENKYNHIPLASDFNNWWYLGRKEILKYLITIELVSLLISLPKSQYNAASPRLDIFLSMSCYNSKLLLWKLI